MFIRHIQRVCAALLLTVSFGVSAQQRVSIGFYNVENLFDTIKSPLTLDEDYTPAGRYGWNSERYNKKIFNLAKVLDDMALDVVGLSEVENEAVIRTLVTQTKTDYSYIHRTTSDRRGVDQVLLYKGDKFFPDMKRVRLIGNPRGREFLYVRGLLSGVRVDILVCHLPSRQNKYNDRLRAMVALYRFADSLQRNDIKAHVIVMGDFNADPDDRIFNNNFKQSKGEFTLFYTPFNDLYKRGYGSYIYSDGRHVYDNIFLSSYFLANDGLRYHSCGIFIKDYLISDGTDIPRGYPLRTFASGRYVGGFSDHLPVYIYFEPVR